MFFSRPHPLSPNVTYLQNVATQNVTDLIEDDEYPSTSCLDELAKVAGRHFDNAFLSKTTNAKDHFVIFCDIWKYFHSGATSTAEEDKQEEDKQEEKENEDDYIDEEAMKRQRLSLGIPSAKDLDELNSSESDTDDEKLNPYSLGNSCRRSTHFFCCN
jgi:hypothetical protein